MYKLSRNTHPELPFLMPKVDEHVLGFLVVDVDLVMFLNSSSFDMLICSVSY
jgi:hypothetical protein